MHPAHPLFQGYMISTEATLPKEAAMSDIARWLGQLMQKGNIKGIPLEALSAGGGAGIMGLLGALLSPGNRWLGGLGGGLLGGGLGYLGGYYGKDKIKDWGKGLERYGVRTEADPVQKGVTLDGKKVLGPDQSAVAPKKYPQLQTEDLINQPKIPFVNKTSASELKLKLALAKTA